jgi:Transposase DDE domain
VLDPKTLSGADIAWLYRQRWSIETAFKTVKRLLGLAYFHGSSLNAVKLQLWATWLLYRVLMDLTDGVAQELELPFERISVTLVYEGVYHYTYALVRGETRTIFEYLAAKSKTLGIVKQLRRKPPRA